MAIPKVKDFADYNRYPTDANPTSNASMQEYMQNQNDLVKQFASLAWQPQTAYVGGQFVFSESIAKGAFAVCVTSGTSGVNEPNWANVGSNTVDGGVTWNVRKLDSDFNNLVNKPTTMKNPQSLTIKLNGTSKAVYDGATAKSVEINAVTSVNGEMVDSSGNVQVSGIDVGMIIPFAGSGDIPAGFLLCNGATVSKVTYPDLFNAIGYTYGGSGNDFNLPNLIDKFIEGGNIAGTEKEAGLPNITGELSPVDTATSQSVMQTGAFEGTWQHDTSGGGSGNKRLHIYFDASRSSNIYGNSDTVQPPALTMRYIIKAFAGASVDSSDIAITNLANELNSFKVGVLKENSSNKAEKGYMKFSNGFIVQWGWEDLGTHENRLVTFPTPFSSMNYQVTCCGRTTATNRDSGVTSHYCQANSETNFWLCQDYTSNVTPQWASWIACGF